MSKVLFITGIDTNIGKTYATAFLARRAMDAGQKVITQKMIQTGCQERSEDIEKHRELLGQPYLPEDEARLTAPIIYSYPCSPHMAAQLDGAEVDVTIIDHATEQLLERGYDRVFLEGAGGLMVPIKGHYLAADFIQERNYPIALVSNGKLGSINHTILSLEVCRNRGIQVECVVYNLYPNIDAMIAENTLQYLRGYLAEYHPSTEFIIMNEWYE